MSIEVNEHRLNSNPLLNKTRFGGTDYPYSFYTVHNCSVTLKFVTNNDHNRENSNWNLYLNQNQREREHNSTKQQEFNLFSNKIYFK